MKKRGDNLAALMAASMADAPVYLTPKAVKRLAEEYSVSVDAEDCTFFCEWHIVSISFEHGVNITLWTEDKLAAADYISEGALVRVNDLVLPHFDDILSIQENAQNIREVYLGGAHDFYNAPNETAHRVPKTGKAVINYRGVYFVAPNMETAIRALHFCEVTSAKFPLSFDDEAAAYMAAEQE